MAAMISPVASSIPIEVATAPRLVLVAGQACATNPQALVDIDGQDEADRRPHHGYREKADDGHRSCDEKSPVGDSHLVEPSLGDGVLDEGSDSGEDRAAMATAQAAPSPFTTAHRKIAITHH